MLRASATTNQIDIDLQGINGDRSSAAKGIPFGTELLEFAESIAQRDGAAMDAARQRLLAAAGPAVVADAAGVAANFQRMVRIADSTGIPVDNMNTALGASVREELNLARLASARNTLTA